MSFYNKISIVERLDGVLVCSKSLDFYEKPIGTLVIKHPFLVSPAEVKSYKCCLVVQQYQHIYPVKLSDVLGLQLYVAFSSNSPYVSYHVLLQKFEEAYDATMKSLDSTTTKSCWCSLLLAHKRKYEQSYVYAEDIHAFGRTLMQQLHRLVVSVVEDIENVYFVLNGMGQCCNIMVGENLLQHFDFSLVNEIVLHIAVDTTLPGYALMWNKSEKKNLNLGNISYEYYPLGLNGSGNFYITKPLAGIIGIPEIGLIKFYGEVFKHLSKQHDAKSPFLTSVVANTLFSSMFTTSRASAKKYEEVEQFLYNCKIIRLASEDLCHKVALAARMELVIRTTWPAKDVYKQTIALMRELIAAKMPITPQQLNIIEMDVIRYRIQDYILPALGTVEHAVSKKLACLRNGVGYSINLGDYTSVAAAECVLGFMLYGSSVSTRSTKRHCNELAKSLKCIVTAYRKSDHVIGPLFLIDEDTGSLSYVTSERTILSSLVPEKIRSWFGCDLVELLTVLSDFKKASTSCQIKVCKSLLQGILRSVTGINTSGSELLKSTQLVLTRYSNHRFVNSKRFIQELRSKSGWDKKVVGNLMTFFEESLNVDGNAEDVERFFSLLVECLEELLFTSGDFGVFPTVSNSVLIVVPLLHLNTYRHSVYYEGYLQMLVRMYKRFGKKNVHLRNIKKGLREVLAELCKDINRIDQVNIKHLFNCAQNLTVGVSFDFSKIYKR